MQAENGTPAPGTLFFNTEVVFQLTLDRDLVANKYAVLKAVNSILININRCEPATRFLRRYTVYTGRNSILISIHRFPICAVPAPRRRVTPTTYAIFKC